MTHILVMTNCKKNTANKNLGVRKTIQNRLMLLSNCAVCEKKKSTFIIVLIIFELISLK